MYKKDTPAAELLDKVIDLKNKTVMPGLIDCHVHLEHQHSKNTLIEGFTLTDADIAYQAASLCQKNVDGRFHHGA